MNKSILVVLLAAAALTAGLYSLPKVVVRNETKQLDGRAARTSTTDSLNAVANAGAAPTDDRPDRSDVQHTANLTPDQQKRMETLQRQFATASSAARKGAAEALITFFRSVSKYDSAARYAEVIAQLDPTERNYLRAGDQYYEAFGFAVDEQKAAYLGQKTRDNYQKALDKNPNLLAAKANLAMTYVSTENPMQGISLLREVLQQDPTNELALFNLGMLSMRSGQYARAVDRFRQILVNNPGNTKAQFYLGVSLAETGQKAEALKMLKQVKAVEKDPQILAAVRELEEQLN